MLLPCAFLFCASKRIMFSVWCMGLQDRMLGERQQKELQAFFAPFDGPGPAQQQQPERTKGTHRPKPPRPKPVKTSPAGEMCLDLFWWGHGDMSNLLHTWSAYAGNNEDRGGDAESAGAPGAAHAEEPTRVLGDAGMILRDPSTFHLLIHQACWQPV